MSGSFCFMFKKLTVIIWGVSDKWANKEAKKSIYRLLKESTQRWCAADEGDSMDSEKTFNVGARCCGTGQSVGLPGLLVQWETSNTERGLLFTQWLSCFQDLVLCSFFQKPSQIDLSPPGDFFACSSLRTTDLRNHIPILSGLERSLQ